MEKLYTEKQYSDMACEANTEGKKLIKVQEEIEYSVEVLEWEKKTIVVPVIDPETGEPTGETKEIEVDDHTKPIMIDEVDPKTGEVHRVQKHHTETRSSIIEKLSIKNNPKNFYNNFFETSLGWVKRKVTMQDGSIRDFLVDILPLLEVGTNILTYTKELNQNKKQVTSDFIQECKQQLYIDFYGD